MTTKRRFHENQNKNLKITNTTTNTLNLNFKALVKGSLGPVFDEMLDVRVVVTEKTPHCFVRKAVAGAKNVLTELLSSHIFY